MLNFFKMLIKMLANKIPKVKQIKQQMERMQCQIRDLELANKELIKKKELSLIFLEGTPYSTVAIPLDYPPSRDYKPRWGYSKPVENIIYSWFKNHIQEYIKFFIQMKSFAEELKHVPLIFDPEKLPEFGWIGIPYSPFDTLSLYSIIRTYKPKVFLEIGSGATTCIAHKAIRNNSLKTKIISIDPEPRAEIDSICDQVVRNGLETCDLQIFDQLEEGDILFFDGSHRSFVNSDVTVFFIDVLPRIKPGVIIHIHDITIPWDYPSMFLPWYWNEQYLLHVYLIGNMKRITPLLPTAFVCREPIFDEHFNSSMINLDTYNNHWKGGGAMWFTHTTGYNVSA